jgi:hypothetical protein
VVEEKSASVSRQTKTRNDGAVKSMAKTPLLVDEPGKTA